MKPDLFIDFAIEEVLVKVDGPSVFTIRLKNGSLWLAYLADVLDDHELFMLFATSEAQVNLLKMDRLEIRTFMEECPAVFQSDFSDNNFKNVSKAHIEDLEAYIPESGELLEIGVEHFSVKLEKPGLNPATAQLTSVEWVLKESKRALKELLSTYRKLSSTSYPPFSQALNGAQCALQPGSLEVCFLMKDEVKLLSKSLRASYLLTNGLPLDQDLENDIGDQAHAFKESVQGTLYALSPTKRSDGHNYDNVVLSGSLFGKDSSGKNGIIQLTPETRETYSRISREKQSSTKLLDLVGRVGEIDKDSMTFSLRDIRGNDYNMTEAACDFSEVRLDVSSAMDALFHYMKTDIFIRIIGEGKPKDKATLLVTKFASEDGSPISD